MSSSFSKLVPGFPDNSVLVFCPNQCVVDPHHINADQDSTYHPGADPGADADSDIYLFDADPDPDPSFIERKSAKIVSS